ncbi:MAG: hypothetical protein Q9M30_09330, partial [Mariprofundaceae bacterium]|nr:hypothetical protein [Mariprofundaceae bacterium]
SLRNLMALRAQAVRLYQSVWSSGDETDLYAGAMGLMRKVRNVEVSDDAWDAWVCLNGDMMLQMAEIQALRLHQSAEVKNLIALSESIFGELNASDLASEAALWGRMNLPLTHIRTLLDERGELLSRSGRQLEIALELLHSRMLAGQLKALQALLSESGKRGLDIPSA